MRRSCMPTNLIKFWRTCRLSLQTPNSYSTMSFWAPRWRCEHWRVPIPECHLRVKCPTHAQQESLLGQFLVIPQLFEWIRCVARFWMTCMQLFLAEYGSVLAKSLRNPSYLQNHSKFKGAPDKPTSPSLNSSASSSLRLSRNRVHRLTEMPWTIWTHESECTEQICGACPDYVQLYSYSVLPNV